MIRLAAIYNVFDADYFLPHSIAQIRKQVDEVIVVYQNVSNFGEYYEPSIPNDVVKYCYAPNLSQSPTWNETRKRNIGLNVAMDLGCTHFISMDCDEFYDTDEFGEYKDRAIEFDSSACQMYTYYKYPSIRLSPIENYYVPFISRIYPSTKLGGVGYPVRVDPTRSVSTCKQFYLIDKPVMHHMSWVREDIGQKLRNSSASVRWRNRIEQFVTEFEQFDTTRKFAMFENYHPVKCMDRFGLEDKFAWLKK